MQFSDIITFTRASGGGRFNAAGQYEWLPANTPRIDYDPVTGECKGLLIEEQRTNLLTYSSDFANAAWRKSNIALMPNTVIAPDGTITACKAVIRAVAAQTRIYMGVPYSARTSYTITVYAKAAGASYLNLGFHLNDFNYGGAQFDILLGTVKRQFSAGSNYSIGATPTIQDVGGGWFKCSVVISMGAVTAAADWMVSPSNVAWTSMGLAQTLTGDGTSGIYIWGAQLESGAFPTSHIPSTNAQVTRAADIASVNVLSPWFNPSVGTFVIEHDAASGRPLLSSGANTIAVSQGAGKLVVAYDAAGSYVSHNGGAYVTGPALTFGGAIELMRSTSAWANAHCASIRYYPRKLSQGEIA